tara:strand:- start:2167 stop:4017 length:1851 start_codon:yes stop_codon:yes gene_type:complete
MAKYIEIKGHSIQATDTDPVVYAGAWSSGGSLNAERSNAGGAGIQTSALMIGQDGSPQAIVEEYNGSSWSEVGDLNTGRNARAMGANAEAAIATGGYDPGVSTGSVKTEEFDGSSWSEVGDLNAKKEAMGIFGISTAGLAVSGLNRGSPPGNSTRPVNVESWDGSSWTEIANVNQGRSSLIGSGIQTSGIITGGNPAPAQNLVESWDGSSWTEVTEMNQNRGRQGAGSGTSNTSAMVFGGYADPPTTVVATTEEWNGSAWTEVADLSAARSDMSASTNAPTSLSLAFGGLTPPETTATEEWAFPSTPAVQVGQVWFNTDSVTLKGHAAQGTGAWASGGNLNSAIKEGGGSGTQTSAINVGGFPHPMTNETYDGSSWTTFANLNSGRGKNATAGAATNAITAAGETPGTPGINNTAESWNGSAWTEVSELNTGRALYAMSGAGTNTATIAFGGASGTTMYAQTETWDGSSWTESPDLNRSDNREAVAGGGTSTSAFCTGGAPPLTPNLNELWDGTSWTESTEVNTARGYQSGNAANNTNALVYGGYTSPPAAFYTRTESWDGSSWTEVADLSAGTYSHKGAGANKLTALVFGGLNPSETTTTEEWEVPGATKTLSIS